MVNNWLGIKKQMTKQIFTSRKYIEAPGFSTLLGFLKYPAKDKAGFYYEEEFLPKDGAELYLNEILSGRNGFKFIETSVNGELVSQSVIQPPKEGENAVLSIDAEVQGELYKIIKNLSDDVGFKGGAGLIMDVNSGKFWLWLVFRNTILGL